MKKLFFIAAIASAALVSCTKNEVAPTAQQNEITFTAPIVGVKTKAPIYGEIGTNYNTNESFGVYAVHTNNTALVSWESGSMYMGEKASEGVFGKGLQCTNKGDYWSPAKKYYWPKEGTLTFAAYSPYEVSGEVSYSKDGLEVKGHVVDEDVTKHVDFLYAPRVYNTTESYLTNGKDDNDGDIEYIYDGVNIMFKHAMSSIVFKVARATSIDANTNITLKSITLNNVYSKGDFKESVTDGTEYNASPKWENRSDSKSYVTYASPMGVDLTTTLKEYIMQVDGKDADVIFIPQELAGNAEVVLAYTITNPGGHSVEQTSTINLQEKTPVWEMGKRYTYNVTIGLTEIIFDPAVTDWVDVKPETDIAL